jgi:hypothetical protein
MAMACGGGGAACFCPRHRRELLALHKSLVRCRRALLAQTAFAVYFDVGQPAPAAAEGVDGGAAAAPRRPPEGRAEQQEEQEDETAVGGSPRACETPPASTAPRAQPASTQPAADGVGADAIAAAPPAARPAEAAPATTAAADAEVGMSPRQDAMFGSSPAPRLLEPASTPSPAALASQSQEPPAPLQGPSQPASQTVLAAATQVTASPLAASPLAASPTVAEDELAQLRPPSALPSASAFLAARAPSAHSLFAPALRPAAIPLPLPESLRVGAAGSERFAPEPGGGSPPGSGSPSGLTDGAHSGSPSGGSPSGAGPLSRRLEAAPPHQPLAAGEQPLSVASCAAGFVLLTYRRWADLWWCAAGEGAGAQVHPNHAH